MPETSAEWSAAPVPPGLHPVGATMMSVDDSELPIKLRLTRGHVGDKCLDVRVSPAVAGDLQSELEGAGVFAGGIIELSNGPDLLIYAASTLAGGGGLVGALTAFLQRHRHKSIHFTTEAGASVKVEGFGEAAARRLMTEAVRDMLELRSESDAAWERHLRGQQPDTLE